MNAHTVVTVTQRQHPVDGRTFWEVETFNLDTLQATSLDRFWVEAAAQEHATYLREQIAKRRRVTDFALPEPQLRLVGSDGR